MQQEYHQPNYGPTEYDFDFTFELDFSFSDYLLLGVYFIFILPVLAMLSIAYTLFHKIKGIIIQTREPKEKQPSSSGLLSFVSKFF